MRVVIAGRIYLKTQSMPLDTKSPPPYHTKLAGQKGGASSHISAKEEKHLAKPREK